MELKKAERKTPLGFTLTPEEHSMLKQLAQRYEVSRSKVIGHLVATHYEEIKQESK